MDAVRTGWFETTAPASGIVIFGLVLTVAGLSLRDTFGLSTALTALGLGLLIAGAVYVATEGPELVRFALVFVALVATQLVAVGGVIRLIGGIGIGGVVVAVAYSRLSESTTPILSN